MTAYVETGFFTGDKAGNSIYFVDKVIPDTTFTGGGTKEINFQMKTKLYPNTTETTKGSVHLSLNRRQIKFPGKRPFIPIQILQ